MGTRNGETKPLSRKQAKLARERVKDPEATLTELAQRSGYAGKSNAKRALDKPNVKARVRKLLDANPKLRLGSLMKKLEEGLEAQETKFFAHEGVVKDTRNCIDYATRHRYLETALELHGLKDKVLELEGAGGSPLVVQIVSYAPPKKGAAK